MFIKFKRGYMFLVGKQLYLYQIIHIGEQNIRYSHLIHIEIKLVLIFQSCPNLVDVSIHNELQEIYVT